MRYFSIILSVLLLCAPSPGLADGRSIFGTIGPWEVSKIGGRCQAKSSFDTKGATELFVIFETNGADTLDIAIADNRWNFGGDANDFGLGFSDGEEGFTLVDLGGTWLAGPPNVAFIKLKGRSTTLDAFRVSSEIILYKGETELVHLYTRHNNIMADILVACAESNATAESEGGN